MLSTVNFLDLSYPISVSEDRGLSATVNQTQTAAFILIDMMANKEEYEGWQAGITMRHKVKVGKDCLMVGDLDRVTEYRVVATARQS